MPTNDRLFPIAARAWLRAQVDRIRRAVMARRPVVRWGAAVVALVGLTAVVYLAATSLGTLGARYLISGRRFSSDDLIKVCSTLDKQKINYRIDDLRRVEVVADQYDQAADAVAKLELGTRPLGEIRDQSFISNFLDSPTDREQRKHLAREKIFEGMINDLPGVVWSLVSINRPQTAKWLHPNNKPTAFVYVETEGNRKLPNQIVQAIVGTLTGLDRELTAGAISLRDRQGHSYLDPGNLEIGDRLRNRAREEELEEDILDKLDWIPGVRVQVMVAGPRIAEPAARGPDVETTARGPVSLESLGSGKNGDRPPAAQPDSIASAMSVNRPSSLEPDSSPGQPATGNAVSPPGKGSSPPGAAHRRELDRQQNHGPSCVLISIPRSFYLNADIRADNREPTGDELRLMKERTENQVKTQVGLITREPEAWKVDFFTIPDKDSLSRPVSLQSPVDARRRALDWGIVGTVVAVVSVLAAVGSWIQVARRPATLVGSAQSNRRFHVDSVSEHGPSERVRELIRRSPEAAASVLQRWTGQGGRG